MYHIDHVRQLVTVKMEPFNQSSCSAALLLKWIIGRPIFLSVDPLYNVMVNTPAKEIKVPRILAIPLSSLRLTSSNLQSAQISHHITQQIHNQNTRKKS